MTKKVSTKRALLMSALSLLLCVSMLVGSTYAWFTDEAVSGNNIIKSGTLDVAMKWLNGKEAPSSEGWVDASEGPIFNNDLWEPGYTEARHIKIINQGTLALNWTLAIVANGEVSKLGDVIDVYYAKNTAVQVTDRNTLSSSYAYVGTLSELLSTGIAKGTLKAGVEKSVSIVLKMREEAGNEYQNLSIGTDFSVKLIATQMASEKDSFDNTYDKFAGKTVVTPENAQAAIWAAQEGDIIYLSGGNYGALVIENENGTPKKGITIEHDQPGNNPTTAPFCVDSINLNSSEDITIRGIYFNLAAGEAVYKKNGNATGHIANIVSAKSGAASGAKNVTIDNCKFAGTNSADVDTRVAIAFEEQGRPTAHGANLTVTNCILEKPALNFIRANYLGGNIIIASNQITAGTTHSTLNFTGNSANLMIRNNTFGFASPIGDRLVNNGWNLEKSAIGTSRSTAEGIIKIEVTGNTFVNDTLAAEGHVVELKYDTTNQWGYTPENASLVFENNKFKCGLADMTEATVPCIWHY